MNASDGARHSATEPPRRSPASARARWRSATSPRSSPRLTGLAQMQAQSSAARQHYLVNPLLVQPWERASGH